MIFWPDKSPRPTAFGGVTLVEFTKSNLEHTRLTVRAGELVWSLRSRDRRSRFECLFG